jgi:hypothetical protein
MITTIVVIIFFVLTVGRRYTSIRLWFGCGLVRLTFSLPLR